MEWTGEAIILGARKHSEADVILEVMTADHGRHLGLVRGGRSRRQQPVLQPGNEVQVTWRARLSDHLGTFTVEPLKQRAAGLMTSALGLHGIQHLASLMRLLAERDPHPGLHDALKIVLNHIDRCEVAGPLLVRFELELLNELGFGLDLTTCAATGTTEDLAYVSPKSARAASREAGAPYHDKLLPLPPFLVEGQRQPGSEITWQDLADGFRLTAFFLDRNVYEPRGIKAGDLRDSLISALEKRYRAELPWNFQSGS
jgi:DNA repair protein RecO (recombination protein O)